jgi:uncharacterized RmlC-like cupin family protein
LPQAADAGLAALPAPAASPAGVVHIRPTTQTLSKQHLPNLPGISRATGATGIAMKLVVVPPGAAATPHLHRRIETRYGPGLRQSVISEPGDFLFIPADVPHQPVNLSATEPAMAVVARNDADEEEHVVLYDPAAD